MALDLEDATRVDVGAAHRRLLRASRRVTRAWLTALVVSLVLAGVTVALTLVTAHLHQPFAVLWLIISAAAIYHVTRFLPSRDRSEDGVVLLPSDQSDRVGQWVSRRCDGWRPVVRLSPFPELTVDHDVLLLGLPLLSCLREDELVALVRDARERWVVEQSAPGVRRALNLLDGRIGRGLEPGTTSRLSRLLMLRFHERVLELEGARLVLADVLRRRRSQAWEPTASRLHVVLEAWQLVADTWLDPALRSGAWHDQPSTGLRSFISACEEVGAIDPTLDRLTGPVIPELMPELWKHESVLAEMLVAGVQHDPEATGWTEHPARVTEPGWRAQLADTLEAARRATGDPQPATLDTVLGLLEGGWGPALVASLRPTAPTVPSAPEPSDLEADAAATSQILHDLLFSAVCVAVLDSGAAALFWSWPFGAVLITPDGRNLSVAEGISHPTGLRGWLADHGVDATVPLWLAEGRSPAAERADRVVAVNQWLRNRRMVLSNRSLRLFPASQVKATAELARTVMHGPTAVLGEYADKVDHGDLDDQIDALDFVDVVQATFTPMIGGHWWRLRIRTADRGLVVWGKGDGRSVEAPLARILGERLHTTWLHSGTLARGLRNGLGFLGLGIGGCGVLVAAISAVQPGDDISPLEALTLGLASLAVIAVGCLPDLVVMLRSWVRRQTPHRAPSEGRWT